MLSLSQGFNAIWITQYERFHLIDLNTEQFYSNFIAQSFEFDSLDNSKIIEFARYKQIELKG